MITFQEFRENLVDQEFNFVKAVADPIVISAQWEKLFSNAITLPLHKDLTYTDQERICRIIKEIIES